MGDQKNITQDVANVLAAELSKLVEGAAVDLQAAATRISTNAVGAAALGRQDLVDECIATGRLMLEQHRIRAVDSSWTAVEAVIGGVIRTLAVMATGGVA